MQTMHRINFLRVYADFPSRVPNVGASTAVAMATRLVHRLYVVLEMPISSVTGIMNRLKQVCIMEWRSDIMRKPPNTVSHARPCLMSRFIRAFPSPL